MKNGSARKTDMVGVQKIKTSELRYRRLFEAAQDGILLLDAQTGAITDVNPFLINMLGYTREEFVEKKLWEVGAFKERMLKPARKLSKPYKRMNTFAMKIYRCEPKTDGWSMWNLSAMCTW